MTPIICYKRLLLLIAVIPFFTMNNTVAQNVDNMRIDVTKGDHLFHFSNKEGSFFVGETNGITDHFLMGYISYRETLFTDYKLIVDGNLLDRTEPSTHVEYYPYKLIRHYDHDRSELVTMPDGVDALMVLLKAKGAKSADFQLLGQDFDHIVTIDSSSSPNRVLIKLKQHLTKFLTIAVEGKLIHAQLEPGKLNIKTHMEKIKSGHMKVDNSEQLFVVGAGANESESMKNALVAMTNSYALVQEKKDRLNRLLQTHHIDTSDSTLNKAINWAFCSFDALNMNEKRSHLGPGIYAGYPWFQDYWGRDSFIALRALIISSQFDLAKVNLLSFLQYQVLKDTSSAYGKVPNRVRPDQQIYNTADATPRFLIEANRYVQYSGDHNFVKNIFPNIKAAITGTIKYRTDKFGFLLHGDADTWMDAVGPKGPYSPRGNRADDIQSLWIKALQSTITMCKYEKTQEAGKLISEAKKVLVKVRKNFQNKFISEASPVSSKPIIYDALRKSGKPSEQLRPNQLFCVDMLSGLVKKRQVTEQVFNHLSTPYGVLSLDSNDPDFHPFHQYEPFYEQDAAYHNGIIWLWNSGELIEQMCNLFLQDHVFPITQNYANMMMKGVTLGTLPELMDVMPRKKDVTDIYPDSTDFNHLSRFDQMNIHNLAKIEGDSIPAESGTFSQAWSLSEYIRSIYEGYLGINYRVGKGFEIRPALPKFIHAASFQSEFDNIYVTAEYTSGSTVMNYNLHFKNANREVRIIRFQDKWMKQPVQLRILPGNSSYEIITSQNHLDINRDGKTYIAPVAKMEWPNMYNTQKSKSFHFFNTKIIHPAEMKFSSQIRN